MFGLFIFIQVVIVVDVIIILKMRWFVRHKNKLITFVPFIWPILSLILVVWLQHHVH